MFPNQMPNSKCFCSQPSIHILTILISFDLVSGHKTVVSFSLKWDQQKYACSVKARQVRSESQMLIDRRCLLITTKYFAFKNNRYSLVYPVIAHMLAFMPNLLWINQNYSFPLIQVENRAGIGSQPCFGSSSLLLSSQQSKTLPWPFYVSQFLKLWTVAAITV